MAVTSNQNIRYRNLGTANYESLPVSGSVHLYQGQLVCIKIADQTLVPASDASGLNFAGYCITDADNTSGASGDVRADVFTAGDFPLTTTGTVGWGDQAYISTDLIVTAATGSNKIRVGNIMEVDPEQSGKSWIRFNGPLDAG